MTGGWFAGDFEPSVLRSTQFEAGVKRYRAGDVDSLHHHKIAKEVTVIISGRASMCGTELSEGDIILIEPGESVRFMAITDVVLVVVKEPSVAGDKYLD